MDLDIRLDRRSRVVLSQQIGRAIIDLIARGALAAGARLPASRVLATQLEVARMSVVEAYGWLADEGYVIARQGSGTAVSPLSLATPPTGAVPPPVAPPPVAALAFTPGLPDLAAFPRAAWGAALARSARRLDRAVLGYGDPLGLLRLRQAIAAYLGRARGLAVPAERVVVTAGIAQAMDVVLRVLADCREVVVETPGPEALERLPAAYGVTLRPVPVDQDGLRTALLPPGDGRARLAYVIPSHQFPLGSVLSLERRVALIDWARATGAFIVEDDYDAEFAYHGRPAVPLARLDPDGRVIYAGTFSKSLAPALRLGFMVVPEHLMGRVAGLKWWADRGGDMIAQDALAGWIEQGLLERHVQRLRRVYRDRRRMLTDALRAGLGDRVRVVGQEVGMHVAVLIRTAVPADEIVRRCAAAGLGLQAIARPGPEAAFVLGFGNVDASGIGRGAAILARAVDG